MVGSGRLSSKLDEVLDLGLEDPVLDFKTSSCDRHSKARLEAVPSAAHFL
jgi:hypothetical protein